MGRYIKYSIPDGILCLLMSVGLSMNIYQGFLLPADLSVAWLRAAVVSGILLVFLFWAAYSRRTIILGVIILIAFAVVMVIVLAVMGIPLIETEDEEANSALWYMLTLLVALGVFLLSRGFAGSLGLIAGGIFLHGLIAAMLYTFYVPALVVYLAAALVSCLFKRYRKNIFETDTRKAAFFPMLGYSAALTGVSIVLALAVWFGALAHLGIPKLNIQLITNIVSIETLDQLGISKEMEILDQQLFSTETNDEEKDSNQTGEDDEDIPQQEQQAEEDQGSNEDSATVNSQSGSSPSNTVNYLNNFWNTVLGKALFWIIIAVIVIIIVLLIKNRRKIWWKKMLKIPPKRRVAYLYGWTLVRLKRLKYPQRRTRTPDEYADLLADKLRFLDTEKATFKDITALMVQVCYADIAPDQEQLALLEDYYTNFHKNCRKHLGFRYIFMYFRL